MLRRADQDSTLKPTNLPKINEMVVTTIPCTPAITLVNKWLSDRFKYERNYV